MTDVLQVTNHLIYEFSSSSQYLTFLVLIKEHLNIGKQTPLPSTTLAQIVRGTGTAAPQGNCKSEMTLKVYKRFLCRNVSLSHM